MTLLSLSDALYGPPPTDISDERTRIILWRLACAAWVWSFIRARRGQFD